MKLDLHLHSEHSFDCNIPVEKLVQKAESLGLDAIAITDHDTMSAYSLAKKAARKITIIPAEEITAEGGTHIIGLFLSDEIFSRNIYDIIDEIHDQKGLVALPHPYRPGSGLIYNREQGNQFNGIEMSRIFSGIDLIEAVNYGCSIQNNVDTDRLFDNHPDIPQIAGSDAHHLDNLGKAFIEFENVKSNSLEDIRDALLHAARLIRYEAYCAEKVEIKTIQVRGRKKSLYLKTKDLIPAPIRRTIETVLRKSSRRLQPDDGGTIEIKSEKGEKHSL